MGVKGMNQQALHRREMRIICKYKKMLNLTRNQEKEKLKQQ